MAPRLFRVKSPLGYFVVLTRNRWREIVRYKHPAVAKYRDDVKACLRSPDFIRTSIKDQDVHLYYRKVGNRHLCVVTALDDDAADRFVVTAYFTKKVKKGDELWTK